MIAYQPEHTFRIIILVAAVLLGQHCCWAAGKLRNLIDSVFCIVIFHKLKQLLQKIQHKMYNEFKKWFL